MTGHDNRINSGGQSGPPPSPHRINSQPPTRPEGNSTTGTNFPRFGLAALSDKRASLAGTDTIEHRGPARGHDFAEESSRGPERRLRDQARARRSSSSIHLVAEQLPVRTDRRHLFPHPVHKRRTTRTTPSKPLKITSLPDPPHAIKHHQIG